MAYPRDLANSAVQFDGMRIGIGDIHLIGKVLDQMDDEALKDLGLTIAERTRATWVFEDIDVRLTQAFGNNWNEREAA